MSIESNGNTSKFNINKSLAKQYYDEMLEHGDNLYDTWLERTEETRTTVANYLGAEAYEIAFTTNTSHGMNLIALMNKVVKP